MTLDDLSGRMSPQYIYVALHGLQRSADCMLAYSYFNPKMKEITKPEYLTIEND